MVKPFVVQQEENPDMEDDMRKDDIWIRLWKLMIFLYVQFVQTFRNQYAGRLYKKCKIMSLLISLRFLWTLNQDFL